MAIELPALPYAQDALAPYISAETLDFHYGKHHQAYVNNINNLVKDTEFATSSLEEIIVKAPAGGIFNNAAQVWNHTCYWNSLSPNGGGDPPGGVASELSNAFGSVDDFKKEFTQKAATLFGSGWTWLVQKPDGSLGVEALGGAGNPLTSGQTPLMVCDVWEHAYYIDYRNRRPDYIEAFWKIINWECLAEGLGK